MVWSKIPDGVDVVVTHSPPQSHCDGATQDERSGCPVLLTRLGEVRPGLSVCGHIHAGRGVERVRWRMGSDNNGSLVESVEYWTDPGIGNKKLSLLDLCSKSGRKLGYAKGGTRQRPFNSLKDEDGVQPGASQRLDERRGQPGSGDQNLIPTSSLTEVALDENEAHRRRDLGSAVQAASDIGPEGVGEGGPGGVSMSLGSETVVINAAYVGPRVAGKAVGFNKPIVVDVELPVWQCAIAGEVR